MVTTLLDEAKYPDSAIARLFRSRWQVELNFRDIKSTLGLDVLRTQTPAMIEKEIALQPSPTTLSGCSCSKRPVSTMCRPPDSLSKAR